MLKGKFLWLAVVVLLLVAGFLQSCSTLEKRIAKAKIVAYENPKSFSEFCGTMFPVATKHVKGKDSIVTRTITVKGDSIECPTVEDKNGNMVTPKGKCPDVNVPCKEGIRVDTVFRENTAKLEAERLRYDKKVDELSKSEKERLEAVKSANTRLWWIISISVAFAIAIVLRIKRIL